MKNILLLLLLLFGCGISFVLAGPLNVVSTTPELGSLAAALGGDRVAVRSITSGREDPHFIQARPTFLVMARDADLWIRIGKDLEVGWEPVLLGGARNPAIRVGRPAHFDGGAYVDYVLDVPDATATRAMGDVHPAGNPHYMLDPLNVRLIATALAERLIMLDKAHAEHYLERLQAFLIRLDEAVFGTILVDKFGGDLLWQAERNGALAELLTSEDAVGLLGGWMATMRPWRGKPIVTFHKSWSYLAHRFGLRVVAELEPLPGVPPSPAHLAGVIDVAVARNVTLILKEPFYPDRPAQLVARRTDARVVDLNSYASDLSPDGYFAWMNGVIAVFAE